MYTILDLDDRKSTEDKPFWSLFELCKEIVDNIEEESEAA